MNNYKIKIEKKIISDNEKTFHVNGDIAFTLLNPITKNHDHYLGTIEDITDDYIVLSDVVINDVKIKDTIAVRISKIDNNSCQYVYYD